MLSYADRRTVPLSCCRKERQAMKQGTAINRILMLLFLGAILLYLGGAAWRGLRDPYPTVQAYSYQVDDTLEATGFLVREEQVLVGNGSIVRLIPAEGEKVHAGAVVAYLYADAVALERSEQLETLQAEESQLTAAIATAGESGSQAERSSQVVLEALTKLRASVESGDFTRLESQTSAFKSAVYQQAQRYGDADELSAALSATRGEIDSLRALIGQNTGKVATEQSGIFSGQVDGYETLLTPEKALEFTPSDLDKLEESGGLPVGPAALARLITNSTWYFVCPMAEEDAKRLELGKKVTVRFSRDWSGEVDMQVVKMNRGGDGRVAVVLSSNRFLSDTTLLRRQTVELVFNRQTGIRVPTQAIRVETETVEDKDTGEEKETQITCVYVQVGVQAERKPVVVLAQGEDYTLVRPYVPEGATTAQAKKTLRAGDQIIIASGEIWDGKVLE